MKDLLTRLSARPGIFLELIGASFLVNALALMVSIFVILVLRNYVTYGIDGTLVTLTVGVLIAVAVELVVRIIRTRLATAVGVTEDLALSHQAFKVLTTAKSEKLIGLPPGLQTEVLKGLDAISQAYSASNICAFLDVPFALMFLLVIALLSPALALICLAGMCLAWCLVSTSNRLTKPISRKIVESSIQHHGVVASAILSAETVRAFNGSKHLNDAWQSISAKMRVLQIQLDSKRNLIQVLTQTLTALVSVVVIALGAKFVVSSDLDIGALIGANILAARALMPIIRMSQMIEQLTRARQASSDLMVFQKLPMELAYGTALKNYVGDLELRDVAFLYPEGTGPLFESLSIRIKAGSFVGVIGPNGAGKTTLARLLLGLLEPSRGQILVGGVELRQVAMGWWRQQVCYMPQEPSFIDGTIVQNILLGNPNLSTEKLNEIVRLVGLRSFIDKSKDGLSAKLGSQGHDIAVGIKRRIALARALATEGSLVVFDEPTDGLDRDGQQAMYNVLNYLAEQERTLIMVTHDQHILKNVQCVIDLGREPKPQILFPSKDDSGRSSEQAADE